MNQSPSPTKSKNEYANVFLKFPEAIKAITEGKRVTKQEWNSKEIYGVLKNGILSINLPSGLCQWIVSEGDMVGDDYMLL